MKVLFLTNIPSPYRVKFFNELGKLCDLTVTFEGEKATDRDAKWQADSALNFKSIYLNGIRTKSDQFLCFEIINILRQKWDRIIIGGYSSPTAMIAILFMKAKGIRFSIEADGGFIGKEESTFKRIIKKFFISSAASWFSTGAMTTDYLCYYGAKKERCYVYPFTSMTKNEIEEARNCYKSSSKSLIREKLGITEDNVILAVGQMIPRKGFDLLIKAAVHFDSTFGVYIVGGKPTKVLSDLVVDSRANVHFVDFLRPHELADYYIAADMFVFPTREDIWGLVINEAMAFGLPIVSSSRCIAALELISEKEGIIFPSEDIESMCSAIETVIKNNSNREMSIGALKKIEHYTIENMAKRHFEVLCSL